jgi:hypothetical protein
MKSGELFSAFCPLCHLMSHCSGVETRLMNAKREILLAVRDLIDWELEKMARAPGQAQAPGEARKKARKVKLT